MANKKAGKQTEQPQEASAAAQAPSNTAPVKAGTVALVSKGADSIPVQLKDQAHLEQLRAKHGDVEVQS